MIFHPQSLQFWGFFFAIISASHMFALSLPLLVSLYHCPPLADSSLSLASISGIIRFVMQALAGDLNKVTFLRPSIPSIFSLPCSGEQMVILAT